MNNKIKREIVKITKRAGDFLLSQFDSFDRSKIKLKSHHEILTQADLGSEKIIINAIKKNFPRHSILSEESGKTDKQSDYLWIIDPLDGTTNFSIHNPLFSVSIAVVRKGRIIFGAIYAPFLKEFYLAEKGKGAWKNNKETKVSKISTNRAIHTFCHGSKNKDLKKATAYHRKQKLQGVDCRQLGSAAIELAFVASGRTESILIPGVNTWDIAAGVLLVRESGGRVTDFLGKKWTLDSPDIIASNGKVHSQILRIINS